MKRSSFEKEGKDGIKVVAKEDDRSSKTETPTRPGLITC
jgi:hypothetical protein